jgi:hypothetical protein
MKKAKEKTKREMGVSILLFRVCAGKCIGRLKQKLRSSKQRLVAWGVVE